METGALNIGAVEVAVRAVGVALPSYRVSQEEALDFFLTHYSLREGTRELFRRVFRGGSIRERRFALQTPEELLHEDLDQTHHRFQKSATDLASRALTEALAKAGASPRDLDFLAVTTCTGSLCPGLSSYVAETVGLRPDVRRADLVGMGCGAALPAMEAASDFLRASGKGLAAVVSSEICSAAILVDDAADLVISNALFADGAAAAILGTGSSPGCPRIVRFTSLHYPAWREGLRFRLQGGRLRNVLSKEVPARSAQALQELLPPLLGPSGLGQGDVAHWILHAGGDKILDAAETSLHLPATALTAARRVLRDFGNMSSPTVLFVLKEILASSPVPGPGVLASFGAGFSAHGALLEF
jgi:predicted naringenin-chalcone synthase